MINYSKCIDWFYRRHPDKIKAYVQSISPKQVECKQWLVDELENIPNDFKNIHLYGGWFGYPLVDMLNNVYEINTLTNIDCDKFATSVCYNFKNIFNHDFVKTVTKDIKDYQKCLDVDLVINTSSEHMPDLPNLIENKFYDKNCVFALQSNNMFHIEDHTNCVKSIEELANKSGLNSILYKGVKKFDNYERYMIIGLF